MGFFSNLIRAGGAFKKGFKYLKDGSVNEALPYLKKAVDLSEDAKTKHEHGAYYCLAQAIAYLREKKNVKANEEYVNFRNELDLFRLECDKTPGLGTRVRLNSTFDTIAGLASVYTYELLKLSDDNEKDNSSEGSTESGSVLDRDVPRY